MFVFALNTLGRNAGDSLTRTKIIFRTGSNVVTCIGDFCAAPKSSLSITLKGCLVPGSPVGNSPFGVDAELRFHKMLAEGVAV
jgi:hypothetical protein